MLVGENYADRLLLENSIAPTLGSLERDVRFVYCACSISYILNDWSGLNIENTVKHIRDLQVKLIPNTPGQKREKEITNFVFTVVI